MIIYNHTAATTGTLWLTSHGLSEIFGILSEYVEKHNLHLTISVEIVA